MKILEKELEQKLVQGVKRLGGWALKFTSPGQDGVPDRIVMMPGKTYFVEMKAPGEKPRPLQQVVIRRMRRLHQKVFTVDSEEELAKLLQYMLDDQCKIDRRAML
ncbi:VRR-NUC domain-containing protein [Megasphaera paucivorans]|uniref:VRR-NUC domain-containing protein n=1 Tax=Megasphaera paucivorans TaxID=349095 RepID=A0A1G9QUI5_9FIRM|nr:VRR-NUC domain-containing protein [Megasphaera paucivorans]SDM14551.1 hypothetical protein SAMN05660299_00283 [Megasphaera paucivorans]